MAMIKFEFTRDGEVVKRRMGAFRSPTRQGWDTAGGGFVPDSYVTEVVLRNTMRKHCFYCWVNADFEDEDALEVCADHAPPGAPVLLQNKYKPGPWDEPEVMSKGQED